MNCARVASKIPLYVGGDLRARNAARITAHMETCGPCRRLLESYRESQGWVQSMTPPEFGEAFYEELRHGIRKEIARSGAQPGRRFGWIAPWNSRMILAGGVALVALAIGLATAVRLLREPAVPPIAQAPTTTIASVTSSTLKTASPETPLVRNVKHTAPEPVWVGNRASLRPAGSPPADVAGERVAPEDPKKETYRIEIQTADPNIRIIWFATKS